MTIAVTGATGQLGRLVIESLKRKSTGEPIVALVRSPEKASDLGVEARAFDYAQPETLAPALAGIDTLLLISSSEVGQREAQHRNVIEAAKTAGLKRIVYTSLLHADRSPISLGEEHRATEALLASSGIPTTLLRNGWYTENYTGSIPAALENGALVGSEAARPLINGRTRREQSMCLDVAAVVFEDVKLRAVLDRIEGDRCARRCDQVVGTVLRERGSNPTDIGWSRFVEISGDDRALDRSTRVVKIETLAFAHLG